MYHTHQNHFKVRILSLSSCAVNYYGHWSHSDSILSRKSLSSHPTQQLLAQMLIHWGHSENALSLFDSKCFGTSLAQMSVKSLAKSCYLPTGLHNISSDSSSLISSYLPRSFQLQAPLLHSVCHGCCP
mmetsp:Transcript_8803/g.13203  ORF Transcript_8803/g.13203 Transcript_8803/m.13203 type:complete len:128 (-) Transcript_8803:834-1217(-)